MAFDYQEFKKNTNMFIYLPKVGEENTFHIKRIYKKTEGLDKFHFFKKVKTYKKTLHPETGKEIVKIQNVEENMGYHIEAELMNGQILSISNISAFYRVFVDNNVQDGDKIKVKHLSQGAWQCEKIKDN
jgi:hypothetical protein